MEFTELYKQSGNLCSFSPNGLYLATAVQYRLVIRDADSLQILHLYNCNDTPQDILWSPDSDLILTANYKTGCIQIWSLRDEHWTAKIEEGLCVCGRLSTTCAQALPTRAGTKPITLNRISRQPAWVAPYTAVQCAARAVATKTSLRV